MIVYLLGSQLWEGVLADVAALAGVLSLQGSALPIAMQGNTFPFGRAMHVLIGQSNDLSSSVRQAIVKRTT